MSIHLGHLSDLSREIVTIVLNYAQRIEPKIAQAKPTCYQYRILHRLRKWTPWYLLSIERKIILCQMDRSIFSTFRTPAVAKSRVSESVLILRGPTPAHKPQSRLRGRPLDLDEVGRRERRFGEGAGLVISVSLITTSSDPGLRGSSEIVR
jgi:hypothetical protein